MLVVLLLQALGLDLGRLHFVGVCTMREQISVRRLLVILNKFQDTIISSAGSSSGTVAEILEVIRAASWDY